MRTEKKKTASKFYNWEKTLSYNADVTMVVSHRGLGKTYGLRKRCIQDYIKNGFRFVEIYRTTCEMEEAAPDEFGKVSKEFPEYDFKVIGRKGYIAPRKEKEDEKQEWDVICYFVSMSEAQRIKKLTFVDVKRFIFDEFIIDREIDKTSRYKRNEYIALANIVDTCSRERSDDDSTRPHVYMLGNACDLLNPYFEFYGIDEMPPAGFRWYRNKTVLLHMVGDEEYPGYGADKIKGTVAGRMIEGTEAEAVSAHNSFKKNETGLIAKKPSRAKYEVGFVSNGKTLGVWSDIREGYIYITDKILEDGYNVPFYITREDATINRIAARKATPAVQGLSDAYYSGILRYSSASVYNDFLDMMAKFGI